MKYIINVIVIAVLISSCHHASVENDKNVIDFESEINKKHYTVQKLSDYAVSLDYIPLENKDESVLKYPFVHSIYGDKCFYIYDSDKLLKFDSSGKYLCEISHRGQGPKEYIYIWSMDMFQNKLYLKNHALSVLVYSAKGEFLSNTRINREDFENNLPYHFCVIDSGQYVFDLTGYDKTCMLSFSNLTSHLLIPDRTVIKNKNTNSYSIDMQLYRVKDQIHFYDPVADTIYNLNKNSGITPEHVFNYGEYKMPRDDSQVVNRIRASALSETDNYIFMTFHFGNFAPEPFPITRIIEGQEYKGENRTVCTIFDKKKRALHLMKQPIPRELGLYNDIDNGIIFWPDVISVEGDEMVMFCPADKFIETYKKQNNPPEKVKAILQSINEESNPVAIVAKLNY
ncbi:MAG: 6-bladed beta-propeller [Tannerella sp.]|jgi:hypothetical protein|nr:6-bladed beta-propeller [Tannerella sp.]